ncbi:hypothetical protein FQN57_005368 [Myotisia sp. PD_48]|nr:hypothetical protein FQN57_005368 [Myotisia sp. PD_48]
MARNVGILLRQLSSEFGNSKDCQSIVVALECLPRETPVHQYRDIASMKNIYYDLASNGFGFCVFLNVSESAFDKLKDVECGRKTHYCTEEILVVKIPTKVHEYASSWLDIEIVTRTKAMTSRRATDDLIIMRSSTIHHKEADCAYCPVVQPFGRNHEWPSVTVEVGKSEASAQLYRDAEEWGKTGKVSVTNGPLKIPFQTLFLRAPNKKNERDILLSDDDLEYWANYIWKGMDNGALNDKPGVNSGEELSVRSSWQRWGGDPQFWVSVLVLICLLLAFLLTLTIHTIRRLMKGSPKTPSLELPNTV